MNITEIGVLHPIHFQSMMNPSTTKVRRRLFEDAPPLCSVKLENQKMSILQAENSRFEDKFNFNCRTNKPLKGGLWDWQRVDSKDVPSFYTRPYIAKTPESLKNHHMACVKNRDKNSRIYRDHFKSLATIENPCVDSEQRTITSTIHPVLPETPFKGINHPPRSSVCGTKRKLSQVDAESDFSERNSDENSISSSSSNSSSFPIHSHSSTETLSTTESSSHSQDNLQNTPCTSTTDNNQSSSQTRQISLNAQQEKHLRQTNLKEFMKSQKSASAPVAKQARRL